MRRTYCIHYYFVRMLINNYVKIIPYRVHSSKFIKKELSFHGKLLLEIPRSHI